MPLRVMAVRLVLSCASSRLRGAYLLAIFQFECQWRCRVLNHAAITGLAAFGGYSVNSGRG